MPALQHYLRQTRPVSPRRGTARTARGGRCPGVVASIPLVASPGAVAWRYMGLRVWQAVLCLLFGFLLAATTAAPSIRDTLSAVVRWLAGSHP